MNQRDRQMLGRVYTVLDGTHGLRARNPADIKTVSLYHSEMRGIIKPLSFALIDLSAGDYDLAAENIAHAEEELATAMTEG